MDAPTKPPQQPSAAAPARSERGLLQLAVEFSSRDFTAGKDFSLFVLVTNPFSVPVRVSRVHVSLPSELKLSAEDDKKALARFHRREADIKARMERDKESLKKESLKGPIDQLRSSLDRIYAALQQARVRGG